MSNHTVVTSCYKLQPSSAILDDEDEKRFYWNIILEYWKLPPTFKHFPGPNPMSLEKNDFERIKGDDFLVALKTDGVRYLLLMTTKPNSTEPISIMIDRTLSMYEVEVWANEEFYFNGCLLDGELVWNNEKLQYIVFDVVQLKGIDCIHKNYRDRLQIIHTHILCIDPTLDDETTERLISEEDKLCARNNSFNLEITPKMCVSKQQLPDIWNGRKHVSHRNDGIILTKNNYGIHTGTSSEILKWKPSHSIDVKCIFTNNTWTFFANDNSSDDEIDVSNTIGTCPIKMESSTLLDMLQKKGYCVVECLITIKDDFISLTPERERTDKKTANTIKTMIATIENAREQINIEELIENVVNS
jgi:hypothetical protein